MTDQKRWMNVPQPAPMPEPDRSDIVKVNDIEMYYAIFGSSNAPTILLIHGGVAHADIWAGVVPELATDYRVVVADTRGHGRSSNDGSAYTIELLASDYLALMEELNIDALHIIGWSDGANIGFELSSRAPQKIISHFAHAGNVSLEGLNPEVETNAVFSSYVGLMGEQYTTLTRTDTDFETFVGAISQMWGTEKPDGYEMLQEIKVPTLVVQSEYDEGILEAHAKRIADLIPNAEYLQLNNVSHFAIFQSPREYAETIRNWVSQQQ